MMTQLTMGINKWDDADHAFERGQQAYLDWCREIAKLYAEGGTTQEEIAGRYDTSQPRIAEAIATGNDRRFSYVTRIDLPKSTYSIYLLTTLPDKDFEELCKPTTTQAVILEHKRRLAAPVEAPRPKCPGVEGIGPGCWKWSEAWGSWEQQAPHAEPTPKPKPPVDTSKVDADWEAEASYHVTHAAEVRDFQIDSKPESILGLAIIELLALGDEPTIKAVKQLLAKAYHPDTGRIRKDAALMSDFNRCFDSIRKKHHE